ncbi:MAG: L-2-amino-thiazoline-4-carboxylic acid hydrolase [Negativicutes bacterium]|nr:L-2-amino-thiazoline-4-carboxylic acid hydrolase [Negativicutes bacterium]
MNRKTGLTARSHAYLFGVIAREVIDAYGKPGIEAIAQGVVRYGRQRGRRMALRALRDGAELSPLNYLAYGEWSAEPGEMDSSVPAKNPDVQLWIKKCPWYDVWQENGLVEKYGYLYCQYVDKALAEGFNPELRFDVLTNRSSGGAVCDMRIRGANATEKEEAELAARVQRLGSKAKMPWDYHSGHLYKTLWEVIVARFGFAGLASMDRGLQAFVAAYGEEAGAAILKLMDIDYNVLPAYAGIDG